MFLGTKNKVYILDKSENNPTTIDGKYGTHPAWAVEYDIKTQQGECTTGPVRRIKRFTCSCYDWQMTTVNGMCSGVMVVVPSAS